MRSRSTMNQALPRLHQWSRDEKNHRVRMKWANTNVEMKVTDRESESARVSVEPRDNGFIQPKRPMHVDTLSFECHRKVSSFSSLCKAGNLRNSRKLEKNSSFLKISGFWGGFFFLNHYLSLPFWDSSEPLVHLLPRILLIPVIFLPPSSLHLMLTWSGLKTCIGESA